MAVRVDDVAPNGYTLDRATVRQKKTGRPVRFELTEQTRQALDDYLRVAHRKPVEKSRQVGRRRPNFCEFLLTTTMIVAESTRQSYKNFTCFCAPDR